MPLSKAYQFQWTISPKIFEMHLKSIDVEPHQYQQQVVHRSLYAGLIMDPMWMIWNVLRYLQRLHSVTLLKFLYLFWILNVKRIFYWWILTQIQVLPASHQLHLQGTQSYRQELSANFLHLHMEILTSNDQRQWGVYIVTGSYVNLCAQGFFIYWIFIYRIFIYGILKRILKWTETSEVTNS